MVNTEQEMEYPTSIKLPSRVVTYMGASGHFDRSLPSYDAVRSNSKHYLEKILSSFGLGNPDSVDVEEVVFGHTKPLRLKISTGGIERRIYVKRPSHERVLGLTFYDYLSEYGTTGYKFNSQVFIESEINGEHISSANVHRLAKLPNFEQSLIKLNVLDKLLCIFNDLRLGERFTKGLDNIVVSSDGTCVPVDFHTAFMPGVFDSNGILIEKVREIGLKVPSDTERRVSSTEIDRIVSKINQDSKGFWEIVEVADSIPEFRNLLSFSGYVSTKDFFNRRLDILGWSI